MLYLLSEMVLDILRGVIAKPDDKRKVANAVADIATTLRFERNCSRLG
jgi:hypothetical protein